MEEQVRIRIRTKHIKQSINQAGFSVLRVVLAKKKKQQKQTGRSRIHYNIGAAGYNTASPMP